MKIIGLSGGSGSGKGAVCSIFESLGVPSVDTDAVYHSITSESGPCLDELRCEFGDRCVRDGALDRAVLREIVFSPPDVEVKTKRLNAITHKYVIAKTLDILKGFSISGSEFAIIDAPLLFESGLDSLCDYTIAVVSDTELRIQRIIARDGIERVSALRRISAQKSDTELRELVDFVIENNGTLDELRARVTQIYKIIKI